MSRWLLQGSSGFPPGKVSKTESASISSKDAATPSLLVKPIDGTSNMEFGGSSASIRFSSNSHKEFHGCSLDPLQGNISGTSTKSSYGSNFLDSTGNSSHTLESLPLAKYGSILSRSATLLASSSRQKAMAALYTRSLADKEVGVEDSRVSGAGDACGSSDTRTKTFGLGLRSKVDLSCFSMKANCHTVAASSSTSNSTHFIKPTSLQLLQAPSVCNYCTPMRVLNVYFNHYRLCICRFIQAIVTLPFSKLWELLCVQIV
ncbi:hypothetical protein TSMEX_009967 [Taenia solium]|eukprot:TsM_000641200 transcript=TsM_000641200 gene=TsM_000641200